MIDPSWAKGIDIAEGDGKVNFAKVRAAGYSFVLLRCIRETGAVDSLFDWNLKAALDDGITVGTYNFWGPGEAEKQAHAFLAACPPLQRMIPAVVDCEKNDSGLSKASYTSQVHKWMVEVEAVWDPDGDNARHAGEYGAQSFLDAHIDYLPGHWLWVASYRPRSATGPRMPQKWPDWTFWQQTAGESGVSPYRVKVDGCPNGYVDTNIFKGTHEDLVKRFNLGG